MQINFYIFFHDHKMVEAEFVKSRNQNKYNESRLKVGERKDITRVASPHATAIRRHVRKANRASS